MRAVSWKNISSYGVIAVGTFFMSVGVNLVYEPMSMVTGGFSGVSIILRALFRVPIWLTTTLLNIPLFLLTIKIMGWKFVKKTLFATVCFSLFLALVPIVPVKHEDYLMAALAGGAVMGVGLGFVSRQGASTGGVDLISTLVHVFYPVVSSGTIMALIDAGVVIAGMALFGIRAGLYAIVAVIVTSKIMDHMMEGLKFAKMVYVISDASDAIATVIMEKMQRGVTALQGIGMYSGEAKKVLLCGVSRKEIVELVHLVKETDKNAFVVISDAKEIMGEGFEVDT